MNKCPKTTTGKHLWETQTEICFGMGHGYKDNHKCSFPNICRLCNVYDDKKQRFLDRLDELKVSAE